MNEQVFVFISLAAFLLGVRATVRLWRRYARTKPQLTGREPLVLGSYVVVAIVCTTTAGLVALISGRRLLGFEALEGSAMALSIVAILILFIPTGLDLLVNRIEKVS